MKHQRALIFSLCLAAHAAAFAQYQWTDKDGRRVFSDRPPPASEQVKNVSNKPMRAGAGSSSFTPAGSAVGIDGTPPAATASQPAAAGAGVDKTLEAKKKQAEAAEAAKKKAEDDKNAAARAESCKRARHAKAELDSGVRIARMNDKGEREVLNDAQRAAEQQRVQQIINQDCK